MKKEHHTYCLLSAHSYLDSNGEVLPIALNIRLISSDGGQSQVGEDGIISGCLAEHVSELGRANKRGHSTTGIEHNILGYV